MAHGREDEGGLVGVVTHFAPFFGGFGQHVQGASGGVEQLAPDVAVELVVQDEHDAVVGGGVAAGNP